MSKSIGIVGLPNVGKSTLFSALTKVQADIANYPFATIEPNVAIVPVPDERLEKLAAQEKSAKIVPATIKFVDIAGLVAGAHKGEGLGNKFLSNIRDVDAILHLVRDFEDSDITHVSGKPNPKSDEETILLELVLADLQYIEKIIDHTERQAKSDKEAKLKLEVLKRIQKVLEEGKPANTITLSEEEQKLTRDLQTLTGKPFITVANIKDERTEIELEGRKLMAINAKLEYEISQIPENERGEYIKELGLSSSGLDRIVKKAYETLNLITFITAGEMETKAWTITRGTKAPQAAGVIHTDFEKGFIKAEVIPWDKLLEAGGYGQARDKGWLRLEGKDYVVADGDVVHFKFNV